jgi:hypothetical protein
LHRWLQGELEDGSDRGSAIPRSVLRELAVGVRSVAEADAWFDAVGMAWEIDSREFHLGPADYEATVERHSRMTAHGIVVVHGLPQTLRRRGAQVVEELRRTRAHAALRPRPSVTALSRL